LEQPFPQLLRWSELLQEQEQEHELVGLSQPPSLPLQDLVVQWSSQMPWHQVLAQLPRQ